MKQNCINNNYGFDFMQALQRWLDFVKPHQQSFREGIQTGKSRFHPRYSCKSCMVFLGELCGVKDGSGSAVVFRYSVCPFVFIFI